MTGLSQWIMAMHVLKDLIASLNLATITMRWVKQVLPGVEEETVIMEITLKMVTVTEEIFSNGMMIPEITDLLREGI